MRKTFRNEDTFSYWTRRWTDIPPDNAMTNENIYPLRYAIEAIRKSPGRILEAGCGAGRVLRYFHERQFDIEGIDYVAEAVDKLKTLDPSLSVKKGNITDLDYPDARFASVLAFGLYHNFHGPMLMQALNETFRVMKDGGVLCASFRADNLCNSINDRLAFRRSGGQTGTQFHKLNLTEDEFRFVLESAGFFVEKIQFVENMSLLYKFPIWRASSDGQMHENKDSAKGYELNPAGKFIQKCLMKFFPKSFCNIHVATAICRKK